MPRAGLGTRSHAGATAQRKEIVRVGRDHSPTKILTRSTAGQEETSIKVAQEVPKKGPARTRFGSRKATTFLLSKIRLQNLHGSKTNSH